MNLICLRHLLIPRVVWDLCGFVSCFNLGPLNKVLLDIHLTIRSVRAFHGPKVMQGPEHARGHLGALCVHTLLVHIFCFHMALGNLIG